MSRPILVQFFGALLGFECDVQRLSKENVRLMSKNYDLEQRALRAEEAMREMPFGRCMCCDKELDGNIDVWCQNGCDTW